MGDKRPTRADVIELIADEMPAYLAESVREACTERVATALLNEGWIDTKPDSAAGDR